MNPSTSAQALSTLQQAQSQSQDPSSILSAQKQQLGVDQAQNTVTGLRGAINNTTKLLQQVAPSVMGRTANSLVTNAQATRQIGNEQAPISQRLSEQGSQYNQSQQDLSQLQQRAQEAASGIYQGQQDKLSYAQNLYNTLYKQEQDAQAAQQAEAARQEQIRQFNAQLAASRAAAGGSTFNLSNPSPAPTPTQNPNSAKSLSGGKSLNDASAALKQLLTTGNAGVIRSTLSAIQASAQKGNTYDQAKLQLINSRPEFAQYLANSNGARF